MDLYHLLAVMLAAEYLQIGSLMDGCYTAMALMTSHNARKKLREIGITRLKR